MTRTNQDSKGFSRCMIRILNPSGTAMPYQPLYADQRKASSTSVDGCTTPLPHSLRCNTARRYSRTCLRLRRLDCIEAATLVAMESTLRKEQDRPRSPGSWFLLRKVCLPQHRTSQHREPLVCRSVDPRWTSRTSPRSSGFEKRPVWLP